MKRELILQPFSKIFKQLNLPVILTVGLYELRMQKRRNFGLHLVESHRQSIINFGLHTELFENPIVFFTKSEDRVCE